MRLYLILFGDCPFQHVFSDAGFRKHQCLGLNVAANATSFGGGKRALGQMGTGTSKKQLRPLHVLRVVQFKVSFLLDGHGCCSVFVGAGRWAARARRFDPPARRARLHREITSAQNSGFVVVIVAYATFTILHRSGKQVAAAIVSQSNDRALWRRQESKRVNGDCRCSPHATAALSLHACDLCFFVAELAMARTSHFIVEVFVMNVPT